MKASKVTNHVLATAFVGLENRMKIPFIIASNCYSVNKLNTISIHKTEQRQIIMNG